MDEETNITDEDSDDEITEDDEEQEEYRYDWMRLAEMGPNVHIDKKTDLGTRDLNRNHNWTSAAQQNYTNEELENARDFVRAASQNKNEELEDDVEPSEVEYEKLNKKQKVIFTQIENYYNTIISG